jgi:hypothetical protein
MYDGLRGTESKLGSMQTRTNLEMQTGCVQWINSLFKGEHFDRAEQRVQQLLQDAPALEERTADYIRRAFEQFYRATRGLALVTEWDRVGNETPMASFAEAYHDLEVCVWLLKEAIGKELLDVAL